MLFSLYIELVSHWFQGGIHFHLIGHPDQYSKLEVFLPQVIWHELEAYVNILKNGTEWKKVWTGQKRKAEDYPLGAIRGNCVTQRMFSLVHSKISILHVESSSNYNKKWTRVQTVIWNSRGQDALCVLLV